VDGVGAQTLEGEGGFGLGAGVGQGLAHQTEVEGTGAEQTGQQAELAELGDERTVDVTRFALLGERAQPLRGQGAQFRTPGELFRSE
jgi:hypothetical protein